MTIEKLIGRFRTRGAPETGSEGGASASNTSWEAITLAVNALATAQGMGVVVYKTKSDMLGDRTRPTGTGAWVLIDPEPSANTSYMWNGNSWQASFDRHIFALGNGSGFQQGGAGAVLRPIQDKLREISLSPKDFFDATASGNFETTDAALHAAIERAMATGQQINIPAGRYRLSGSKTFPIDLGKFSLVGEGDVTFDCSEFTGSNVFQVFSSCPYPAAAYKNAKHKLSGITLIGCKITGRHGILIGHETHAYNGQINLENIAIARFDRNHHYTHNAWRIEWRCCTFIDALTRMAMAPAGLVNAGEVIQYNHCQFSDGDGDIEWACAGWQVDMVGCSILNTTMFVTGHSITVNLFGGNIENPKATAFYDYIHVSAHTCRISLFGTRLTMNNPHLFIDAPFKVAANSTLQFVAVTWPDGDYLFEKAAGQHVLCSGDGMVVAHGCSHRPESGGSKAALSLSANCLRNGNFEEGTLAGWTILATGKPGSSATNSIVSPRTGSRCGRLSSDRDGGISLSQKAACRPGELAVLNAYVRLVSTGSGENGNREDSRPLAPCALGATATTSTGR